MAILYNVKMNKIDVSIIIPAYEEAENLKEILPKLSAIMKNSGYSYEILVIDTIEATDNTEEICLKNNVTYIKRQEGNNYCNAVETGIKSTNGIKTIFMDADGSHSPEFLLELLKYKDDFDVVIASRYIDGGKTDNNFILKILSQTLNKTYGFFLGLNCKDISNSLKLYDTKQLKELNLKCENFDIIEEILFKLNKHNKNFKIKEIPYYFKNRKHGKTKRNLISFTLSYIYTLIKLKFSD